MVGLGLRDQRWSEWPVEFSYAIVPPPRGNSSAGELVGRHHRAVTECRESLGVVKMRAKLQYLILETYLCVYWG